MLTLARGSQATITVIVDAPGESVNAISGDIVFDTNLMEITGVSKAGSVLGLWVQEPSYTNENGTAHFEGVALNPGYSGSGGKIATITVRAKGEGTGDIAFGSASVLANDGSGTNIMTAAQKLSYTITPAIANPTPKGTPPPIQQPPITDSREISITSETHPDPKQYENSATLHMTWQTPPGAESMAYSISQSATAKPSDEKPIESGMSFDISTYPDGIWYIAIRFKTAEGWTNTITREVRIDRTPPLAFAIEEKKKDTDPTNPKPRFDWGAKDALSGITKYDVRIDTGSWIDAATLEKGSYIFPPQKPGQHLLTVRAYDGAGNIRESTTTFAIIPIATPNITMAPAVIRSPEEAFVVAGNGAAGTITHIRLWKGSEEIAIDAPVDRNGNWNARYENRIPGGIWEYEAISKDARGALSEPTVPMRLEVINSVWDHMTTAGEGSLIILSVMLLLACLGWIGHTIIHRMRIRNTRLKRDLTLLELELERDIAALEENRDDWKAVARTKGGKRVAADLERIRADIKNELARIKGREY
jgi:hypothetical protein